MQSFQILHKIRRALSLEELADLLKQGEQFTEATERTRSRWKRHAEKRRKFLEDQQ